jgi:hypothetical protein
MIYFHSERSEQFLKQNDLLTFSWRFLRSNTLQKLELKLEKINNLDLEIYIQEKLEKGMDEEMKTVLHICPKWSFSRFSF